MMQLILLLAELINTVLQIIVAIMQLTGHL